MPHTQKPGSSPAIAPPYMPSRDTTVVRIPLRRAKHHLGTASSRGSRPYNEDTDQAGTIDIPAFAKRAPQSVRQRPGEAKPADSILGDPQVFYFAVFDGHGGTQCSHFLRDELHGYIEQASVEFGLQSSLRKRKPGRENRSIPAEGKPLTTKEALDAVEMKGPEDARRQMKIPGRDQEGHTHFPRHGKSMEGASSPPLDVRDSVKALKLQRDLVAQYKRTIGGYFRRFSPEYFNLAADADETAAVPIETVLSYAFLRADLDFVAAQAQKPDPDDLRVSDVPLNDDEILGSPHATPSGHGIGGNTRFKGGSTASIALISTSTAAPFWHPGAHSTLMVAHERIAGLANSRAFGDMKSKRIGVSAEPEITRVEMAPAQYSFLVLVSDGVSGTLSDQEIVDVIKEARTPEQGAQSVVDYATEVSHDGDNATCQVVRLGGWERRSEGGVGSLGTKEIRDIRRTEAGDPRRGRQ
uniref:PPM-type phosphatase domain-containing protein n=1 Tax=Bionectria ochroleuca TaxID=29856 RepID=A0A0B7K528_BIOOC